MSDLLEELVKVANLAAKTSYKDSVVLYRLIRDKTAQLAGDAPPPVLRTDSVPSPEHVVDNGESLEPQALGGGRLRRIFNGPFAKHRQRIVDGLVKNGVKREDAESAIGDLGDGTILKWLWEYGDDILRIVLMLLPLFL